MGGGGSAHEENGNMAKKMKKASAKFPRPSGPTPKGRAWDKERGGWEAEGLHA